jgi:hypothetical protein
VGVIPALAAGKTCALGSRITSIMACANALRSQPAKVGVVDESPDGDAAGLGSAGVLASAPPGELLVLAVGIDFDTFQGAEGIRGERSR